MSCLKGVVGARRRPKRSVVSKPARAQVAATRDPVSNDASGRWKKGRAENGPGERILSASAALEFAFEKSCQPPVYVAKGLFGDNAIVAASEKTVQNCQPTEAVTAST